MDDGGLLTAVTGKAQLVAICQARSVEEARAALPKLADMEALELAWRDAPERSRIVFVFVIDGEEES